MISIGKLLYNLKKNLQLLSLVSISRDSFTIAFQKTLSKNYSKYLVMCNFLVNTSGLELFFSAELSDPSKLSLNSPPLADYNYFLWR